MRPFLALPRSAIDDYAKARALAWVDDESNANTDVKRNFIRHEIAARLAAAFPGYPATLARSAAHQAETAKLIDELAAQDASERDRCRPRRRADARSGSADRARRAALRTARGICCAGFCDSISLRPPSTARLAAMHDQLVRAAPDARVRLVHSGAEIGIHRNRIVVHPPAVAAVRAPVAWRSAARACRTARSNSPPASGNSAVPRAALPDAVSAIRSRAGGERIRLAPGGPTRALKRILQEAGMPLWLRDSLPLVFCGEALAVVPGIGVAVAFHAAPGAPGYAVSWHPAARRRLTGVKGAHGRSA